jgi:hypothetical protein
MLTWGLSLLFLAAVSGTLSMARLIAANPDSPLPMWQGRPQRLPQFTIILRGLSGGLGVFGVFLSWSEIGFWSVLLLVVALGVPVALNLRHNRRFEA